MDYFRSIAAGAARFYDPVTFGFTIDFTNLLRTFINMARSVLKKMMGDDDTMTIAGAPTTRNPKAQEFTDFVNKQSKRPPDVLSRDFQPGVCKVSPNAEKQCNPSAEVPEPGCYADGNCGLDKDCVHYWAYGNKNVRSAH